MKLDRTLTAGKRGKYSVILERKAEALNLLVVADALATLKTHGVLDDSVVGDEGEFFVIRLKDKYAGDALAAYAAAALADDPEYAQEIASMAGRAGNNSPFCKKPD